MKKIAIFLSILFTIISTQEIKVLITKQTYKVIIGEIEIVVSNIYDELSKHEITDEQSFKVLCLQYVMYNIHNNMPRTFNIFDFEHDDPNIRTLAYDIISLYVRDHYSKKAMSQVFKTRFITFLSIYGFPKDEQPFITLDSKIENGIINLANTIIQKCANVQINQGYQKCVEDQFSYILYPLLPTSYTLIIQNSNLINETIQISYQPSIDVNIVINNIITKITNFLDNKISNDSQIAKQMETYFTKIKNQCLKLSGSIIIKDCVTPNIKSIYNLIPFDLEKTSDWIIDEFMRKLPNSNNKMDMLVKIFLNLKIKSSNNNTLRLLDSEGYGYTICKWLASWFCFDDDLCE